MAESTTRFPEYVTDGHHIYLWHPEYERMLEDGRLRPSDPPEPPKVKKLTPREKTKLDALRKKALQDAENAVRLLSKGTEDLFGAEPKEE